MKKLRKFFALLLCMGLCLSLVPGAAAEEALSSMYEMKADYEKNDENDTDIHYSDSLEIHETVTFLTQNRAQNFNKSYSLTGNGASDIVAVATAQIGKNRSDLGYSEAWCANFLGDCADLAGLSDLIPRYGGVSGLRSRIIDNGADYWDYNVSSYISNIKAGDIVVFLGNDNSHISLVEYVTDSEIHCIDGNWSDAVQRVVRYKQNSLNDNWRQVITTVLRPHYDTVITTYLDKCTAYPTNLTVKTTKSTYLKSLPCTYNTDHNSTNVISSALPTGTSFTVTELYRNDYDHYDTCWYKVSYNGKEGYIYSGDTSITSYNSNIISTSGGNPIPTTIPKDRGYWVEWLLSSDYLNIDTVQGYISYQGGDVLPGYPSEKTGINSKTYQLGSNGRDEPVDAGLPFLTLSPGKYTCSIQVKCLYYYGDSNGNLQTKPVWKTAISFDFTKEGDSTPSNPTEILPEGIGLIQNTSYTCTLASAAMMLRARMYRSNNSNWTAVTEESIKPVAWCDDGLYHNFIYRVNGNSMTVGYANCSGMSVSGLKTLLDNHPEGIVLYERSVPHAIFVCDYQGDTFYCFDPASSNYSGRRTLSNSWLATRVGNQSSILSGADSYWYVSSYSITPTGPHTHDKGSYKYYWDAHPHYNCYQCSICGEIWEDRDSSNYITNCDECRPGKPKFIGISDTYAYGEPVTFSWNATEHTTHYNFWLYKLNESGNYELIEHTMGHESTVESPMIRTLGTGKYKAVLQAYDSNHWFTDHRDWVYSDSDPVCFEVRSNVTYTVSFDANGGSGGPEDQIVPEGEYITLSTVEPTRDGFAFLGWATSSTATTPQYRAGSSFVTTGDVTLYAVWERGSYSDWSESRPENVEESLIETKTQYRYRDKETTVSSEPTLDGWTPDGGALVQNGSGSIQYVNSWPSGFDTGHSLYGTYNNSPMVESDTLRIDSDNVTGYIYWHWCRGTYTDGPINRTTKTSRQGEWTAFHAFYSSTSPDSLSQHAGDGSHTYPNSSACRDSHWYYATEVRTQTYTTFEVQNFFYRWNEWSSWSDIEVDESDNREVESRIMYRYLIKDYTIAYDANGGRNEPESQIKAYGDDLSLSVAKPSRASNSIASYFVHLDANGGSTNTRELVVFSTTSYTFKNWNTAADGSGTSYAPGATYSDDANVTLYAQWESNTSTNPVELPTPTRSGYVFKGWATSSTATTGVTGNYIPTGNVTLYAVWIKPDLTLPAALTTIESEAFAGGGFSSVLIPPTVKTIALDAFGDRTDLTILGTSGSYAETFAGLKNFTFVPAA